MTTKGRTLRHAVVALAASGAAAALACPAALAAHATQAVAGKLADGIDVSARVDPGKPYRHTMIYRLSVTR